MNRSRRRRVLAGEEEEGRMNTLSDEDLRAKSHVLKPTDKRKYLQLNLLPTFFFHNNLIPLIFEV
jgi:hypothetical protein